MGQVKDDDSTPTPEVEAPATETPVATTEGEVIVDSAPVPAETSELSE